MRLEAVRAASFFTVPEAIEVPLISADQPTDQYLDFVRGETMRALDPIVSKAIKAGKQIQFTTTAGGALLPQERQHGRSSQIEANAGGVP